MVKCQQRAGFVLVALALVFVIALTCFRTDSVEEAHSSLLLHSSSDQPSSQPRCRHVYVDLGTNVGIQIRKLYEPHLYPKAAAVAIFDKYFGPVEQRRTDVCTFGFEPNPRHTSRLQALERAYRQRHWDVTIFTGTAVGTKDGVVYFQSDHDEANNEWGSRVVETQQTPDDIPLPLVGLTDFFAGKVRWNDEEEHVIVVKVDVEGMDYGVLAALLTHGELCRVSYVYVEHVKAAETAAMTKLMRDGGCATIVERVDDEKYGNSTFSLPAGLRALQPEV